MIYYIDCAENILYFSAVHVQRRVGSTQNFDREFTKMSAENSPSDEAVLNLLTDEFKDFSYVNIEFGTSSNWKNADRIIEADSTCEC